MTVNEFRKKGGFLSGDKYALSVVFGGETEDALVTEFRQAKEALVDWFARRGSSGDMVMFVVAARAMHEAADATIRDIVANERELAAPLQARTVRISLMGIGGRTDREAVWAKGRWT